MSQVPREVTYPAQQELCPVCRGRPARRLRVVRAADVAVCAECGSWYRVPRPTAADLTRIYDREYYNAWGLDEDEQIARTTKHATFAPIVASLERAVPAAHGRPRRILDVGAGTGLLLDLAARRGWEAYAVELNPYGAEVLRRRLGRERVFEGELVDAPFATETFEAVTMTDLIEHVLDVPGTLRAVARLLRPGGVVCITTPRIDSLSRLLLGRQWLHFKEEHIQYFSRAGIQAALREAGFAGIQTAGHPKHLTFDYLHRQLRTYPHPVFSPLAAGLRRLLPAGWRRTPVAYRCGEMLVLARRPGGALVSRPMTEGADFDGAQGRA